MAEGASVQTIVRVLEMHIKTRRQFFLHFHSTRNFSIVGKAIPIVVIAREDAPEGDPSQLVFSEVSRYLVHYKYEGQHIIFSSGRSHSNNRQTVRRMVERGPRLEPGQNGPLLLAISPRPATR